MPSDPTVTPPPVGTPDAMPEEHPYVRFSRSRWFFTGIVRLLYRRWTRIAAFLFPEDSKTEHLALALHTPDTRPFTIEQMLQGSRWVQERIDQGGHVLIHCEHGVGRSALLACAVLVYDGMNAQDALHLVQHKR